MLRPHPRDQREPARHPRGVEPLADLDQLVGGRRRPDLHAQRVVHAGEELDVRAVELPRALPIQSMCAEQSYQSPVVESRRVSASS